MTCPDCTQSRTRSLVKTPAEIALLRMAAGINQRALEEAVAEARRGSGVRWADVVRAHKVSLVRQGGSVVGDKSLLFGGEGGGASQSMVLRNEDFALQAGQFVTFDCLGAYQGYHCDFGRMGSVGPARAEHRRVHEAVLNGLAAAEDALRPGVGVFEVRRRGVEAIVKTGLAEAEMTTCITHGVGLELFELGGSSYAGFPEYTLEEDMVVNIDFFYRGLGRDRAPAHVEDSYRITPSGLERLYTMSRALIEL